MHIPPMNVEIERVYNCALAKGQRTLAVTAASPNEGTTSIAIALAQRNLLAGRSTLVVDMNLHRPALKKVLELPSSANRSGLLQQPLLVSADSQDQTLVGITAPSGREALTRLRKPGVLDDCISDLLSHFDTLIFDTSSVNRVNANNVPAELVCASCDATLLVVLSGQTPAVAISSAVEKLDHAGAHLAGTILNDRDSPPLRDELLRETQRLSGRFHRLRVWLANHIRQSNLLSMEI